MSGRSPSVGGTCRSHGTDYRAGGVMLARDRTAPGHSSGGGASPSCRRRWRLIGCVEHILPKNVWFLLDGDALR